MTSIQNHVLLALSAAVLVTPVAARGDAVPGHHGGQVQDAGPYHVELVIKPRELVLYVTGSGDRKVETRGATGTATVLSGKSKETIRLTAVGENGLAGAAKSDIGRDAKVVVTVTIPGQAALQARFAPHAGAPAGSGK